MEDNARQAFERKWEANIARGWTLVPLGLLEVVMRVHRSLRVTPVMQAGISDHIWTWGELLGQA